MGLSAIIPYRRLRIETDLTPKECALALRAKVKEGAPGYTWGLDREDEGRPFRGHLSEQGFSIHRIIRYRNSFLPFVEGAIPPRSVTPEVGPYR